MMEPWIEKPTLRPEVFSRVRERAIFECCKWDPQVEDVATLASFPLVLTPSAWMEIKTLAEALARETLAAERELLGRPDLHKRLGLPGVIRRLLRRADRDGASNGGARVIRFDFHFTTDGWRVSEANTDVPGGFLEGSGLARLMAHHYPGTAPTGDPAGEYSAAIVASGGSSPVIALVHATAYTDDHQQMVYIGRQLEQRGARVHLVSPEHVRWDDGQARIAADWANGRIDFVARFFPAEWLPNLPRRSGWSHFFIGGQTPISNPGAALLTQSKRFPLAWDTLATPLPTWRALLPETRNVREVDWRRDESWVLKPVFGRVGDGIGLHGVTGAKEWRQIIRGVRWHPRQWVAQRRFQSVPMRMGDEQFFPCIGVFTIGERVVGAYGRLARRPLIDHRSQEAAVLIEHPETAAQIAA